MAEAQRKWNQAHPEKLREASKKHRKKYPERVAQQNKERALYKKDLKLKQVYGLSLAAWTEMFESQGRVCAICGTSDPKAKGWNTDHCHKTGRVRGILCSLCNWLLGSAQDNVTTLKSAITYLERQDAL